MACVMTADNELLGSFGRGYTKEVKSLHNMHQLFMRALIPTYLCELNPLLQAKQSLAINVTCFAKTRHLRTPCQRTLFTVNG